MGSETNVSPASPSSAAAMASSSPAAKRSRDPEDEVYIDNLHSHKRYLSEIMASSLNGLTVGDNLADDSLVYSPRDDLSLQYSPMSEDSDDLPSYEVSMHVCSSQPESSSMPTSPVSPYRHQRPLSGLSPFPQTTPTHGCNSHHVSPCNARQRGSDSEGRFPSSPSDICHSADLRRAALLRSVQMRTQPHGAATLFDLSLNQGGHEHSLETDEGDYQIAECSSSLRVSESEGLEKHCGMSEDTYPKRSTSND
ncbi:unnamed protein product [Cuscuta campestris]|uniref:Uncharacterized protein n=2 Tax=Cuscuta sect. Cleistogrammica TaxID=1824901 RepID=A0A484KCN4_9ASTE|nr:hypothetical protein DM860_011852 [Cuscuta australis]VFQ59586.1 unnamed protein product [Cuscuta campestris]